MRIFVFLLALILPFLSHADESDQDRLTGTGTIIGRVAQAYIKEVYRVDDTIVNATVMIQGTSYGAMTDSAGVFLISSVPEGNYVLYSCARGYSPSTISVQVSCDDTVDVGDVFLSPGYPCPIHYFIWPRFETIREIEIELISDSMLHNRENMVQFYYRYTCLPSSRNGNTHRICLSDSSFTFQCKVAGYGELNINLDEEMEIDGVYQVNLDSLFAQYPTCTQEALFEHISDFSHHVSRNQWIADDYSAEHDYIDISRWGDRDLVNWGYIDHRVFYDENNERRILLVYHKWAVLLGSGYEPRIFNFSFPVKSFYSSQNCRYLLVLESIGYRFQGGDAQFIDTFNGKSVCFDPTPENPEPDGASSPEAIFGVDGSRRKPFYLISNNGRLVRVDFDQLHFYNMDYSPAIITQVDIPLYTYRAGITQNDDSLLAVGVLDNHMFVAAYFDMHGNMIRKIDLESKDEWFNYALVSISPVLDQVLLYQVRYSLQEITRLYCTTGQVQKEWQERFFEVVYSPSGNLICSYSDSMMENEQLNVSSTETFERILTIHDTHPFESRQDLTVISSISRITDNGYFIVRLRSELNNTIESRYALFDITGNIVWLSSCFDYNPFSSHYTISSDGSVLSYMDGIFLHFITFEHDNHNLEE